MIRNLWLVSALLALAGCSPSKPGGSNPTTATSPPPGVSASSSPTEVANVALNLISAEAVSIASRSIFNSIQELDASSRRVVGESIEGERATCTIEGTRNGNLTQRNLYLVREGEMWKLVPSHR